MEIKLKGEELTKILDKKDDQIKALVSDIDELLQREKMVIGIMSSMADGQVISVQYQGKELRSTDPQFHSALTSLIDRNYETQKEMAKQYKNKIEQILQSI